MRTISRVFGPTIALAVWMMSPASVFTQENPAASEDREGGIRYCSITPCLLGGARVLDAPCSAVATTVWYPPTSSGRSEMRSTARYYRDPAGRVRVELGTVGDDKPFRVFVRSETDGFELDMLDPKARTVLPLPRFIAQQTIGGGAHHHFVLLLSPNRFVSFRQVSYVDLGAGAIEKESLGRRMIVGGETEGTRVSGWRPGARPGPISGELWVSPELALVVYGTADEGELGTVEYQLSRISRADQRAELFEVPSDYKKPEVSPGRYGSWEGPYRLLGAK